MTKYKQGEIVLVSVVFSEGTGTKKRPALIISSDSYQEKRQEVIIAAITSNVKRILFGDTMINQWKEAGLLYPSVVTGILQTVKHGMIVQRLGKLSSQDFKKVRENIKEVLRFHT